MVKYRICNVPGCPELTPTPKCQHHTRQAEQHRGNAWQRGYNTKHNKKRKHYQHRIDKREVILCAKCGHPITNQWDLGHTDNRQNHTGPEHTHCNRKHGGKRAHRPA